MELTLAISPCPNDVYIFAGILTGAVRLPGLTFRVHFLDVQAANEAAVRGEFDLMKISYAAYPAVRLTYARLPSGGALGRRCGPLLLRNGPGGWDPDTEVLVPGAQTTANALLDFYARRRLRKRFLPFDTLYEELQRVPGTQGVVIHEKRFVYAADGLNLLVDLGEHWEEQTGHPIPLGLIVLRRGKIEPQTINALLQESLAWADANRDAALALCRSHAQDLTEGVIEAHIGLYVNAFSHELGPEGEAAVAYFLHNSGTLKPEKDTSFI